MISEDRKNLISEMLIVYTKEGSSSFTSMSNALAVAECRILEEIKKAETFSTLPPSSNYEDMDYFRRGYYNGWAAALRYISSKLIGEKNV